MPASTAGGGAKSWETRSLVNRERLRIGPEIMLTNRYPKRKTTPKMVTPMPRESNSVLQAGHKLFIGNRVRVPRPVVPAPGQDMVDAVRSHQQLAVQPVHNSLAFHPVAAVGVGRGRAKTDQEDQQQDLVVDFEAINRI